MTTLDQIVAKFSLNISPAQRQPIEIPGLTRNGLAHVFAKLGFTRGVEIGVFRGRFAKVLLTQNKQLHLTGVDPWGWSNDYVTRMTKETQEQAYELATARLMPFKGRVDLMRMTSAQALTCFENDSLDFVYVDGSHQFSAVVHDIYEWSKKVRPGGIISGHDLVRYQDRGIPNHTYEVVMAYTAAYRIKPWFVCGAKHEPGRDTVRSWFWVKG